MCHAFQDAWEKEGVLFLGTTQRGTHLSRRGIFISVGLPERNSLDTSIDGQETPLMHLQNSDR